MTYDEINALVFDPFFAFERLVDKSVLVSTDIAYQWPVGYEGEKNWDNCAVNPKLLAQVGGNKPTDDELLAGPWAAYIAELTAAEDARLAEISRISSIKTRWEALGTDQALLAKMAGINKEYGQILVDSIATNNLDDLTAMEAQVSVLNAKKLLDKGQAKQNAKINLGFAVVALMGAINSSKNLTGEQTGAMVLALQTPMALLMSGSTNTAIGYIQTMVLPTGITEADRTAIVAFAQDGLAKIEAQYG